MYSIECTTVSYKQSAQCTIALPWIVHGLILWGCEKFGGLYFKSFGHQITRNNLSRWPASCTSFFLSHMHVLTVLAEPKCEYVRRLGYYIRFRIWEKGTNVQGNLGKIREFQFTTPWMPSMYQWKTMYFWKDEIPICPKIYTFSYLLWRHSSSGNQDFPCFLSTLVPVS